MSSELESVAEFLTGNRMSAASLPWQALRNEDLLVLRDWAGETLPRASQRRLMRDLRHVLSGPFAADDEAPRSEVALALLRPPRRQFPAPGLARRQAKLLLAACESDEGPEARRDAAVIALMLHAGLRRKEIVELRRQDYDDDGGRLRVASRSGHARSVLLEGLARDAVEAWLSVRGTWQGALVSALSPRRGVLMRSLAPSAINRLLGKRATRAGCAGVTPRDLRGRFLWQLRSESRERPRCRYYQDEDGQPAWLLASMTTA